GDRRDTPRRIPDGVAVRYVARNFARSWRSINTRRPILTVGSPIGIQDRSVVTATRENSAASLIDIGARSFELHPVTNLLTPCVLACFGLVYDCTLSDIIVHA